MHIAAPGDTYGRAFYNQAESLDGMVVEFKGGHRYRVTMNEYPNGLPLASEVIRAPHCKQK